MPTIPLHDYINLLVSANKSPLLTEKFTLITQEQKNAICSEKDYELLVTIQQFEPEELEQLKQLGLIKDVTLTSYYKLYRVGDWLSLVVAEQQRREHLKEQTAILSKRLVRINEAQGKLCGTLKVNPEMASLIMREHVLKGLMPEIARILNVEDLVNKPYPEQV